MAAAQSQEDFLESEILWPEFHIINPPTNIDREERIGISGRARGDSLISACVCSRSAPANIPEHGGGGGRFREVNCYFTDDGGDGGDGGFVPPHEVVDGRFANKVPFSLWTLRGRDLSRLRNSVLRMTGFLET